MKFRTTVNYDAPQPDSLFLPYIAHSLASRTLAGHVAGIAKKFGRPSLAQMSVNIAGTLRKMNASPTLQLQGLLYFGGSAFVPHWPLQVEDSPMVRAIEDGLQFASGKMQLAVYQKFSVAETWDDAVVAAVRSEVSLGDRVAMDEAVWDVQLATWMFESAAVTIASDLGEPTLSTVLSEVPASLLEFRWVREGTSPIPSPLPFLPREGGSGNFASVDVERQVGGVVTLSNDLRAVFARHGFDPATPAFSALIVSMEKVEAEARAAAAAESKGKPASKPPEKAN